MNTKLMDGNSDAGFFNRQDNSPTRRMQEGGSRFPATAFPGLTIFPFRHSAPFRFRPGEPDRLPGTIAVFRQPFPEHLEEIFQAVILWSRVSPWRVAMELRQAGSDTFAGRDALQEMNNKQDKMHHEPRFVWLAI